MIFRCSAWMDGDKHPSPPLLHTVWGQDSTQRPWPLSSHVLLPPGTVFSSLVPATPSGLRFQPLLLSSASAGSSAPSSLLLLSCLLSHSLPVTLQTILALGLWCCSLSVFLLLQVCHLLCLASWLPLSRLLPTSPSLPPCVLVGSSSSGLVLILLSQEEAHGILEWRNSRRVQQRPNLRGPGQK